MRRREEAIESLRSVQREYEVGESALKALDELLRTQPDYLTSQNLQYQDLKRCQDRFQATYIIRLFAEFEANLRDYWATCRNTEPPMRDLLNSVATRCRIKTDWHTDAQKLREHRNDLVHHANIGANPQGIHEAAQVAAKFLSALPPEW